MIIALAGGALAADGARQPEMKELADDAQSLAKTWLAKPGGGSLETWIKSRPVSAKLESCMKDLWYDAQSLGALDTLLNQQTTEAEGLYAANCLLRPLLAAKSDVIRQALPSVQALHRRVAGYVTLPQYTPAQLEAFQAKPQDKLQQDRLQAARLDKTRKELAAKFKNEQSAAMTRSLARLMVYADKTEADEQLITMITSAERDGQWDYTAMLEAVRSEAGTMKQPRAERFYKAFYDLWREILQRPQRVREYADPAAVKITPDAAPEEVTHKDNAGERFLKVLNQLAVAAKQPALQNPRPRTSGKQPQGRPRR